MNSELGIGRGEEEREEKKKVGRRKKTEEVRNDVGIDENSEKSKFSENFFKV